jgi:hypothetical protein
MLEAARLKLTNADPFSNRSVDHILAVLSQRLCVDPVLVGSEAMELADRSVAHHMRLLTGVSLDHRAFYTYSPSEPILTLAAAEIIYCEDKPWARILDNFSNDLCKAGLVEKGLLGELGARTLLLIARDFTAPKSDRQPDLLQLVSLLKFLDTLFGNKVWCGNERPNFERAFGEAFINFTHWVATKDQLPQNPDQ